MKKIKELPLELAEKFDLPAELLPGTGRITIVGGRQARIEGHKGILEYTDERLLVVLKKGRLCIAGAGLEIQAMNNVEILLSGRIDGVELT